MSRLLRRLLSLVITYAAPVGLLWTVRAYIGYLPLSLAFAIVGLWLFGSADMFIGGWTRSARRFRRIGVSNRYVKRA